MQLTQAIDRQDSAGYNHVQGYTAREESQINRRLQYHLLDVQDEILGDPRMVAQAMENFDYSDACHFESLLAILMSADRENLDIAHEAMADFLRSKLTKQIEQMAQARVDEEMGEEE